VIVKEGLKLGMDVPCNETVRNQVLFLQNRL
jgi:hypothetical protein